MNTPQTGVVAIVGASNNQERYANKAQQLLMNEGYTVLPVTAKESDVLGVQTASDLRQVSKPVDTVTLYINPRHQGEIIEQIIQLKPRRVIFNPGTENPEFFAALQDAGIDYEEACTLVLLRTGQF